MNMGPGPGPTFIVLVSGDELAELVLHLGHGEIHAVSVPLGRQLCLAGVVQRVGREQVPLHLHEENKRGKEIFISFPVCFLHADEVS